MRALFVLLASCGYQTTQVFNVRADSLRQDVLALDEAVSLANAAAGCELLRVTADGDKLANITFADACGVGLGGETESSTFAGPSLCLRSLAKHPESLDGPVSAATAIYLHELGHAAGLEHVSNAADIMNASIGGPYDKETISRFVAQLRNRAGARCLI